MTLFGITINQIFYDSVDLELSYLTAPWKVRFINEVTGKKEIPSQQLVYSPSVLALKCPFFFLLHFRDYL